MRSNIILGLEAPVVKIDSTRAVDILTLKVDRMRKKFTSKGVTLHTFTSYGTAYICIIVSCGERGLKVYYR